MTPLHTDEFVIRPFEPGDASQFVAAVQESGTTLGPTMPWWKPDYSVKEASEFFASCAEAIKAGKAYDVGIFQPDGSSFIGGISVNRIDPDYRIGNVGYWVRESMQNRGLCTKAAEAIIEFGLNTLGLVRLEIVIMADNAASRRVAEKVGATLECIAKNRIMHKGVPLPAAVYSVARG